MADLSTITVQDVVSNVIDNPQGDPLGSDWQSGQYTGVPWRGTQRWVCNALQWIADNTPYEVRGTFEFRAEGVFWGAKVIRQSDGVTVREMPIRRVQGHVSGMSDPYKQVIEMMRRAAVNVANFAAS